MERELQQRNLKKGPFALSINEYPQLVTAITKGRRRITPAFSLKAERALGLDDGFFMVLQAYYDIEQEKLRETRDYHPDLSKFRKVLFWDTEIDKINWTKHKPAVIRRVFERGNKAEIMEIIRFYGKETVRDVLSASRHLLPTVSANKNKYLQ